MMIKRSLIGQSNKYTLLLRFQADQGLLQRTTMRHGIIIPSCTKSPMLQKLNALPITEPHLNIIMYPLYTPC